jgi:hypothetical protein
MQIYNMIERKIVRKKRSLHLHVSSELLERVQNDALEAGFTVSSYGAEIVAKYYENKDAQTQQARDELLGLRLETVISGKFQHLENRLSSLLYRFGYEAGTAASLLYFDLKARVEDAELDQMVADTEANVQRRLKSSLPQLFEQIFAGEARALEVVGATGD